jgi:hypothetical protein
MRCYMFAQVWWIAEKFCDFCMSEVLAILAAPLATRKSPHIWYLTYKCESNAKKNLN